MARHELFERIQTWNVVFDKFTLSPTDNQDAERLVNQFDDDWDNNMLKNASALEMIEELENTVVEKKLINAISLAKSKDKTKLDEIHLLLLEVQKFMYQNNLI